MNTTDQAPPTAALLALYPALRPHWLAVAASTDVRHVPVRRMVLGTPLALFRTAQGRVAALADRCPHRNAPLSRGWVSGECVVCPYHGWQFDADGACQAVPGLNAPATHPTRRVPQFMPVEQDGWVWVRADPSMVSAFAPPRFPLAAGPGVAMFRRSYALHAALPDAIENFLDGTHTHYVHNGWLRVEGKRKRVDATVRRTAMGVEVEYHEEQQSGLVTRIFGGGVDVAWGRFRLPSLVELEYQAQGRTRLVAHLHFTPESLDRTRLHVLAAGHAPGWLRLIAPAIANVVAAVVVGQDRRVLALQARNLARWEGPHYVSTPLDVVGPHVLRVLRGEVAPGYEWPPREVELWL